MTNPREISFGGIRFALLALLCCFACDGCHAAAAHSGASAHTVGGAGVSTTNRAIPVTDPVLGVSRGVYLVPPGWTGTARMDRTDMLMGGMGTMVLNLTSPDGKSHLQSLPKPFHTYTFPNEQYALLLPGDPLHQPNARVMRFGSTASLLTQIILPMLHLPGQVGAPGPGNPKLLAAQAEEVNKAHVPYPITDAAVIPVHDGGREFLVTALTGGFNAGTQQEVTNTVVGVVSAPEGKARAILAEFESLQQPDPPPAWQQADAKLVAEIKQNVDTFYESLNRRIEANTRSLIAQGQANLDRIHKQGEERQAEFYQHEQMTTDLGALNVGYLSGSDVSYKWCGPDVRYTVNDTHAPDSGYHRCD